MCRIWGISYGPNEEEITTAEIATILYPALVHQGPHAWGWMSYITDFDNPETTQEIQFFRTPGRCDTFAAKARQLEEIPNHPDWVVGHLRYATHGKPQINVNNHPIPHGHIIGVHNGVLRNHESILKVTGREDDKAIVDSEAIFAAVNKYGRKEGLAMIEGDMATVFADDRDPSTLYIARSHGRQITIGWTDKGNIIFASEEQALRRLEPMVDFLAFSVISENKMLTLIDGEIFDRQQFAPVVPRYVPPPPTERKVRDLSRADDLLAAWEAERKQKQASKRGDLLFPKNKTKKSKGRKAKPISEQINEIVTIEGDTLPEPEDGKLYYLDGELLSRSEYEMVIETRN